MNGGNYLVLHFLVDEEDNDHIEKYVAVVTYDRFCCQSYVPKDLCYA